MRRAHVVTVVVGGVEIGGWTDYNVEANMLAPADSFTLTRPADRRAWNVCELDALVQVQIDGTPIVTGYIGDLGGSARSGTITIAGRCKAGRLVSESAPGIHYAGLKLLELVRRLAEPWFTTITTSDARNRDVRRGKRNRVYRASAGAEPVILDNVTAGGRIEPGQVRWQVIEDLVTQAGYLAWSSADGLELIVGRPNYAQEVQWLLRHSADEEGTVLDLEPASSIEDAFSQIQVIGSGRGTDADYGTGPADRVGVWRDGVGPFGVGLDFIRPKRLVIVGHSLHSARDATELARREARRRNMKRRAVTAEVAGHGQVGRANAAPTIFAPNTLARVVWDRVGLDGVYLVTGCRYQARRDQETTTLSLVPKGTELTL